MTDKNPRKAGKVVDRELTQKHYTRYMEDPDDEMTTPPEGYKLLSGPKERKILETMTALEAMIEANIDPLIEMIELYKDLGARLDSEKSPAVRAAIFANRRQILETLTSYRYAKKSPGDDRKDSVEPLKIILTTTNEEGYNNDTKTNGNGS
jgi:hypothetical protein